MEKKEILRMEREMFQGANAWLIRPCNARVAAAYDAQLEAMAACMDSQGPDLEGCLRRAKRLYEEEVERSGRFLTSVEVGSPAPIQFLHQPVPF